MSGWILAVDFGTVNTGAAILFTDTRVSAGGPDTRVSAGGPDGRIDKVKLDPNSDTMPSAVVLTDGHWRVGQAALHARRTYPETFIGSPKTRLGQEPIVLGDEMVDPARIAAHVLTAVRERAVRAAGGTEPDRLVLTHPVRWGQARLSALKEAARLGGFSADRVRLVPEPIATLHAHVAPRSLPPGSRVAVVDTGGGTCDVAILQTTDNPAPGKDLLVVAQEGDDRLGGNDLDDLLYQWVLAQLRAAGRQDMLKALAAPEHLGAALTLLDVVRSAKQDLSEHTTSPIGVAVAGHETTLMITREEYEDLIAEPMARAGALVTRALEASRTTALTGLYLTGGVAYTPALARTLHKVTGILTAPLGDPKLTTAIGALKTPVAVMSATDLRRLTQEIKMEREHPGYRAAVATGPLVATQPRGLPPLAPTYPSAPTTGLVAPAPPPKTPLPAAAGHAPTPRSPSQKPPKNRGVTIAMLASALVVVVALVVALVLVLGQGGDPGASTSSGAVKDPLPLSAYEHEVEISDTRRAAFAQLSKGDCFRGNVDMTQDTTETVACTDKHTSQIIGFVSLTDSTWEDSAADRCKALADAQGVPEELNHSNVEGTEGTDVAMCWVFARHSWTGSTLDGTAAGY